MANRPLSWRSLPPFVRAMLVIVALPLFVGIAFDGQPNNARNDAPRANSTGVRGAVRSGRGNPDLAIVAVRPISSVSNTSNGEESNGPIQVRLGDVVAYSGLIQAASTSTPTTPPTPSGLDNYTPSVPNSTPTIYITNVDGRFFYPPSLPATAVVVVTTQTPPAFTQQFPVINFNPPQGYTCAGVTVDSWTHPLTDVDESNPCAFIIAQATFPAPTPSLQAGVPPLGGYQAVFLTNLYVSQAADITFHVQSDDSFIWGIGPRIGDPSAQPTRVSGIFTPGPPPPPTPYPTTAFGNYPVVAQHNDDTYRGEGDATIHFPAEGFYPIEIDNAENEVGSLFVTLESPAYTPVPNGPSPTPTVAPTVTCSATSQWCSDLSPNVGTGANTLRAVAVIGQNPVNAHDPYQLDNLWAVGGHDVTQQGGQSLIERRDGQIWSVVSPVPDVGTLNGVASVKNQLGNAYDAWAVGDIGILHYDSSSLPSIWFVSSGGTSANGVAARAWNDVWAVGTSIQHWSGSSWSVESPNPIPTSGILYGVALSSKEVWAVGYTCVGGTCNGSNRRPLIMRKSNGTWTTFTPDPTLTADSFLKSVDVFDTNYIWAVGSYYDTTQGYYRELIEHWNGVNWTIIAGPTIEPGTSFNELRSVWINGAGDIWAAGAYSNFSDSLPDWKTFIAHWGDTGWDKVTSPDLGAGGELFGIATIPGTGAVLTSTWAVGDYALTGNSIPQTLVENITAPAAPIHTTSYYETTTARYPGPPYPLADHFEQGCLAAQNQEMGTIVLDYGQPRHWGTVDDPSQYGTQLTNGGVHTYINNPQKASDIERAAEQFAIGYHSCRPQGWQGGISLVLGINNDKLTSASNTAWLDARHAQAWATMVDDVHRFIRSPPDWDEIEVYGGIDAEPRFDPNYDTPPDNSTKTWVSNFHPALAPAFFYDFGSTDGYPKPAPYVPPAGTCCSPWTAAQLYEISYGLNDSGIALPEIYKPPYARNWHRVQRWSIETNQPHPLFFDGVMSECQSSDCTPLDPAICKQLYPSQDELYCFDYDEEQAWQVHWLETNADPQTHQILLESTDIKVAR